MRRTMAAFAVAIVCAIAGAATTALGDNPSHRDDRLPDWIRVAGRATAGMTAAQAQEALEGWRAEQRRRPFVLVAVPPGCPRRMWTTRRGVLGAEPDVGRMIRTAFRLAHSQGFWDRVGRWLSRKEPVDVAPAWLVHEERLRAFVRRSVEGVLRREPRPARLVMKAGRIGISPDSDGLMLDTQAAMTGITRALSDHSCELADLPLRSVPPSVTAEEAAGIEGELASFETHYSERGNRRRNLELACSLVSGTILKPGGVFSYNDVVGPRDADNGFKMAPVIVRGRMEPGMGGGVCQVSTTVYNAGLLAGLEVVSRTHHAFPVHYVPPGRDATVVYGAIDLKLRNSSDGPIGFLADGTGGRVRVRVFGKPNPALSVRIERTNVSSWAPSVQTVTDPTLPRGKSLVRDRGRSGHRVTVWRVFKENGNTIRRELISRDVYRAYPRIVAEGSALPAGINSTPGGAPRPGTAGPPAAPPPSQPVRPGL